MRSFNRKGRKESAKGAKISVILMLCVLCNTFACFAVKGSDTDTIRIGLLVQYKESKAARQGAELAIMEANRDPKSGKYFALKVRHMEGPWGTGAKESVSLVFSEDVWAVIGATDGRNAHLAEQVSAKTTVPYITAWSGDPTLGQAFIPWFFSCVPNDLQTAGLLIDFISEKNLTDIVIIVRDDYDSRMSASSFLKKYTGTEPEYMYYKDEAELQRKAGNLKDKDCIIFFGSSSDLRLISQTGSAPVLAPYILMSEDYPDLKSSREIMVLDPGTYFHRSSDRFTASFLKIFGTKPVPPAAYAYDAVKITIIGINQAGNDESSLYRNISGLKYNGVTGEISFDGSGNRKVPPRLIKLNR